MSETSKLAEGRANRNTHVSCRALSATPPVAAQEDRAGDKALWIFLPQAIITRLTEPPQVTSNKEGPLLSTYSVPGTVLSM